MIIKRVVHHRFIILGFKKKKTRRPFSNLLFARSLFPEKQHRRSLLILKSPFKLPSEREQCSLAPHEGGIRQAASGVKWAPLEEDMKPSSVWIRHSVTLKRGRRRLLFTFHLQLQTNPDRIWSQNLEKDIEAPFFYVTCSIDRLMDR